MKSKKRKEINVELIPVYISNQEFQEHKEIVQDLIVKILLDAHKKEQEGLSKSVRFPRPSPPIEVDNG